MGSGSHKVEAVEDSNDADRLILSQNSQSGYAINQQYESHSMVEDTEGGQSSNEPKFTDIGTSGSTARADLNQELPPISEDPDPVRKQARAVADIADGMSKELVEALSKADRTPLYDKLVARIRTIDDSDIKDALLGLTLDRRNQVLGRAKDIIRLSSTNLSEFYFGRIRRKEREIDEESCFIDNHYGYQGNDLLGRIFSEEGSSTHRLALVYSLLEEWHPKEYDYEILPDTLQYGESFEPYWLPTTISIYGRSSDGQERAVTTWHSPTAGLRKIARTIKNLMTYRQWLRNIPKLAEQRRRQAYEAEMRLRRHLSYNDPKAFQEHIRKHGHKYESPALSSFAKPEDLVMSPVKILDAIKAEINAEIVGISKPFHVTFEVHDSC